MKRNVWLMMITVLVFAITLLPFTTVSAQQIKLGFATALPEGGSEAIAMKHFKKILEERTNGEIQVNLFLGGVLGKEKSVFEQLTVGEVQMNLGGEIVVTTYAPKLYIFGVPFLFPDRETIGRLVKGDLGKQMSEEVVKKSNIMVVGYSLRMGRQLITKDRRVFGPEDVKGLKMRLPNIKSWQIAWRRLGAIPTPIPAVEIFHSLQTGVVEAAENPVSPMVAMRQYEVTKYLMLTDHLYSFRAWSLSKRFYDTLKPDLQKTLLSSIEEAADYLTSIEKRIDTELLVKAQKAEDWQVIIPDREAFKKAVLPAVEEIRKDWAPGLYEKYVKQYVEAVK
ncbi:MAG: DctP family TRAP transporter solute-binding subunit [Proteobacteria bacterium]|nr:DctP family TRAP transporter solute-binding subunit [Pseudomonadota bacterium]